LVAKPKNPVNTKYRGNRRLKTVDERNAASVLSEVNLAATGEILTG
jgi:hypothetical protein